jgi:NADH-quinone oxidoreductase subunit K
MGDIIVIILLVLSSLCFIIRNNFIMFFISLEIYLLAINFNFIFYSILFEESTGILVTIILLVLGAIDTTIGLSLIINYYNLIINSDLKLSNITNLKG